MERRSWLERVANELSGQGLPVGVRVRLLEELQDHLEDLMQGNETMATEAVLEERMGNPRDLATTASLHYRGNGWVRRHPLLVFGIAPLPAILLSVALYMLVVAGLSYLATQAGYDNDAFTRETATTIVYGIGFVPFLGVALVLGRLAGRSAVGRWWQLAALAQIAVIAGVATVQLNWSDLPGRSQLTLGLSFPLSGWRQGAQLLLPLVVGFLVIRSATRRPVVVS